MSIPLRVQLWKKLGAGQGWGWVTDLDDYLNLEVEARIEPGHFRIAFPRGLQSDKIQESHLITFDLTDRPQGELDYCPLMTGRITRMNPRADQTGAITLEVEGTDLLGRMGNVLCWPRPTLPLDQQNGRYGVAHLAEHAFHTMVVDQVVLRRGEEVTVAASQGRGGLVVILTYFGNVLEFLVTKGLRTGIGTRRALVRTSPTRATETIWFTQSVDRSNRVRLSHRIGVLNSWSHDRSAPTATYGIVGGEPTGDVRPLRTKRDAVAEALWGESREVFLDQRSTSDTAEMDEALEDALDEAKETQSFELDAVEARGVKFGQHFDLGDRVTVELPTAKTYKAYMSAVKFTADTGGWKVTLIPGTPSSAHPYQKFARAIGKVGSLVSYLQRES